MANSKLGGIVGENQSGGKTIDCYSTADITTTGDNSYAAGIAGYNSGTIEKCYAGGSIYGSVVAGICGYGSGAEAQVKNCVAVNKYLSATKSALRILGGYNANANAPATTDNYAFEGMPVSVNNIPQKIYDDPLNGTTKTIDELHTKATYEALGWDMENLWKIDEGSSLPYFEVFSVPVSEISLDKTEATLERQSTLQLTATVLPEDCWNNTVIWTSDNESVAIVDGDGLVTAVGIGEANITATAADGSGITATCKVTVTPKLVTSVTLDQSELTIEKTYTAQLSATITPDDADNRTVTWTSDNEEVATVDENGQVTAVGVGEANITATAADGSGVTATCKVTVTPKLVTSVTLDQSELTIERTYTAQLSATIAPEDADNRTVTWTSDNEEVATVDENGQVTAVGVGEANITATAADGSGITATCKITVTPKLVTSVTLDQSELTIEKTYTAQLSATITPDDADNRTVTWTSDNEEVATVDENGLVTAVGIGEANITAIAADGSGVTATCKVTVTPKLVTSVTLDQSELTIERTYTAQLSATIAPEDADNRTVTWTSDNEEVATVDENGQVTAVGVGEANITATAADGSGITATCKVTVTPKLVTSVTLDESELTIEKTYTAQLSATITPDDADNRTVTWTSDNEEVATVDENGQVTAVGVGEANITAIAADGSGVTATCKVTVTPKLVTSVTLDQSELTIERTYTAQLSATIAPEDADNRTVTWTSDNEEVATVDENGQVTAVGVGEANITAIAADGSGVTATCKVTVTPKLVTSVTLDQSELTIERTYTAQLSATITPEDADNRTVSWTSDNEEVATVDENGLVTAVSAGEANITATAVDGSGVTATCKVTVTPKLVTSVILDESELTIEKNFTEQLTATVAPDDADNLSLTWTSDNEEVATVDENGLVTAVGEGTATITATANDGSGVSASCVVTVTFIDGIADVEASKVTVLAVNGRITVSGKEKDDTVSVYDTGGRLLYQGESDVIDAPRKAMYIVTVSGKSYKVIVP